MKYKIKYILPNFLELNRNKVLLDIYTAHKDITIDNSEIYSFYGTFPNAIWNGGRVSKDDKFTSKSCMKKIRDFYNKQGIAVTFTFTNPLIEEKHLNDEYCNQILKIFNNGMNEVLVVSPILEKYVRENYPKYKINKSITFADKDNPYDTKKYHLSVLDKNLNHNIGELKKIKDKDKIEILCDEVCFNDCKFTKQHYTEIGNIQLGFEKNELYGRCKYINRVRQYEFIANRNKNSKYYISPDAIQKTYAPMGFQYYKLSGRENNNFIGWESVIDYLIKPKYQNDVRSYIFEKKMMEGS